MFTKLFTPSKRQYWGGLGILLTLAALTACNMPGPLAEPTATNSPTETPVPTQAPTPTATPQPRSLTICVGQEPNTLYPYGGTSRSMWSVLEAVYDGPIDTRHYTPEPVILEQIPSLSNGGASLQPVDVKNGDPVVNADGDLVSWAAGQKVLPSGCTSGDCAITWDGTTPLKLDQLAVTFKIKSGITWSDGQALTADDSLYSYQLASDKDTPVSKYHINRTFSYDVVDPQTVKWVGRPGYLPASYAPLFFIPLPKHAWQSMNAAQLQTSDVATQKPLGWGPYQIDEWVKGDHIRLVKNPAYFRASEGLPKYDILVYRFLGEQADNNLEALLSGECSVVDQTSLLDEQLEAVLDLQRAGKLKAAIAQGPEMEFLAFGIKPASYDDGYQPWATDRADIFSDVKVRQAFAYCINRQNIIDKQLFDQSALPASYLAPDHPLFDKDLIALPYDPEKGKALLEEAGWKNFSGDPAQPRVAATVNTVNPGTPLTLDYVTSEAPLRVEVAKMIVSDLAECGVQVNVRYLPVGDLYLPGPQGVLFGRQFDLAQFSWESGLVPPCQLFESAQIPATDNNWLTPNLTGYSNPAYDTACQLARYTRPDNQEAYFNNHKAVQSIFAGDLPVLPLYFRLKVAVTRPDFCGLEMDATSRSALWNIEAFDEGDQCK
ncbi:MAG: peptide ABC transporter substrate-binding protein [Anaerolineae bacterium]|nr:peptide ABC transporter substrate-binding protein [Anaerolineae bacterium]